mgnify:CR=1 FL=1
MESRVCLFISNQICETLTLHKCHQRYFPITEIKKGTKEKRNKKTIKTVWYNGIPIPEPSFVCTCVHAHLASRTDGEISELVTLFPSDS